MKEITSIPNAIRTFEALRSLGYDLNSSIADVVDNSMTAKVGSKHISIYFGVGTDGKIGCSILDDGSGMNESELEEAMRLGTNTTYKASDLGKFGMGMKTASLSHCNMLTVISKKKRQNITGFRWDIAHIKNTKDWELLKLDKKDIDLILEKEQIDLGSSGTLVLWNELFIIENEFNTYSNDNVAYNYIARLNEKLRLHLGMVFHRFLDGSLGKENTIQILLNEDIVKPWDPFCRDEPATEKISLKKEFAKLSILGFKVPVNIDGYILPSKEAFSSETAWKEAKGLLPWNDSQGYYIYRANRLIRFGGWHGTKALDEHDKLARIAIDIDPTLDELFRITVNKAKVQFPEILFNHLKHHVNPFIVKKAKAKYKKSDESLSVKNQFRRKEAQVTKVSRALLNDNGIKTTSNSGVVKVANPSGTWLSNKIHDFLKYGSNKDFEIVSGNFEKTKLWKIICSHDDKFKVIINASHPFYPKVYGSTSNKAISTTLDALFFSLAFAELYIRNDENAEMFESFKSVCAQALEKLIQEEII